MKYLTIILLFSGYFSYASDSIFSIANSEYDNENYKSAIEKYQEIVSDSLESPELYFNMGNCFYKLEDYASAIFFYEKSLLIQNDFVDAKENIADFASFKSSWTQSEIEQTAFASHPSAANPSQLSSASEASTQGGLHLSKQSIELIAQRTAEILRDT